MNQKSTFSEPDLGLPAPSYVPIELTPPACEWANPVDKPETPEYILVSDITSEVIDSSDSLANSIRLAGKIRKAGGAVTVFKATKY